jgi:tRNA (guanine37-N1)-methyltransferase
MQIDVLTLFPALFAGPLDDSIIRRARERGQLALTVHNLRDFANDRHRTVDDRPFGGGPGMILKPEPIFDAVQRLAGEATEVILLTPGGATLNQATVRELASCAHLLMISGSYEGVDDRVRQVLVDREISIGDYILTNGALPAMVLIDAVARLLPGVLGDAESPIDESFSRARLEHPHYTRPAEFRGLRVPDVLLSGDHKAIAEWREAESVRRTRECRPDLLRRQDKPEKRESDAI